MDSYDRENAKSKQSSIEYGFGGYDVRVKKLHGKRGLAEVSTDKILACLFNLGDEYRKFYWDGETGSTQNTAMGDYGIKITKEEYDNLMAYGSHLVGCIPSDRKVYHYYVDKYRNR